MYHFELLEVLSFGFLLALALGLLTHRLRLSPIVGYLLAGFLVGPNSPGFVADPGLTNQLAEVGVILLMFGVGLHFDLKDLLAVKWIAVPGAVLQSLGATALGIVIAMLAGMSFSTGLILGLGMSVASTVVLMRVLMDNKSLDTIHGHVAVGWLIVEDIFTILVLVLLPPIAMVLGSGIDGGGGHILYSMARAIGKLAVLWILILPVGGRVVPWLMAMVARTRSRELFILTVLVLAFVIATGSALLFGASVALGAFLAGMVVGKTSVSHQAASDLLPMRDAFAVLFFISVGMLFDPVFLLQEPVLVTACLLVILVAKPLLACLVVLTLGYTTRTALTVAFGLAQIGEFSFILAQQAILLDLMPREVYSILVACALISIALNPLYFKLMYPLEDRLRANRRIWQWINRRVEQKGEAANLQTRASLAGDDKPVAVVVGYGPVGQRVTELLRSSNLRAVIIDLNVDTVQNLVRQGHPAVYGDSRKGEILREAGIERAEYLLITIPDLGDAIDTITTARAVSPEVRILVRARHLGARTHLEGLGVTAVSFEEEEVANSMTRLLQARLQP